MQTSENIDYRNINMQTVGARPLKKIRQATIKETPNAERTENLKILETCMLHYLSLGDFRARRRRNRLYYRGNQWSEQMKDPDNGQWITEEQYIISQGKMPLKQNVIRQLVKNILGQWRGNKTKSRVIARAAEESGTSDVLTNALQAALDLNVVRELDARCLEEFLLSGAPIQKVGYKLWKTRDAEDLYLRNVNPNRIFFNTDVMDVRLHDLRLIGEIIDATLDDVVAAFGRNKADQERIKNMYQGVDESAIINTYGLSSGRVDHLNFLIAEAGKYRVIEVWRLIGEWRVHYHDFADGTEGITKKTLAEINAENQQRIAEAAKVGISGDDVPLIDGREQLDQYWEVRYLTPLGDLIQKSETPYWHGDTPYNMVLYPLLDGEVWGFVEDIIDQQRYINRLISMLDFIIGASAKGVLLVHEDSIPDDMTPQSFASEWTKFGGVIKYKGIAGTPPPTQVAANSVNIGAADLLAIQMKLMNEISGVHGAIQGQGAKAGTPASLYAQEAQNATLNILEYMEVFARWRQSRDTKALQTIQQFYKGTRHLVISGADYERNATEYDAEKVRNTEWELQIAQSVDSPVYRQAIDDLLVHLLDLQAIDVEMYLENSSMPYAEKMLSSIRENKKRAQETGVMPPEGMINPEMIKQASQDANPKAMEMLDRLIKP